MTTEKILTIFASIAKSSATENANRALLKLLLGLPGQIEANEVVVAPSGSWDPKAVWNPSGNFTPFGFIVVINQWVMFTIDSGGIVSVGLENLDHNLPLDDQTTEQFAQSLNE